ncbi:MAG: phosphoribosylformimino-5-aminoimidazole carboxamide ribotide isomerase [Proteobacteria bacterium]|nr:phosphoribosylformimino-5-aminoimidazole carboxamide ribotide isomerase [Pseudomonadota bacterium]MBU1639917.1 phosphoribosylformimino-5-aminoimidazole carboxamide ribotide isomerase [Pseudomonadota bacterium]
MKFRPCIDLHNGCVKQIVGSSLSDTSTASLQTNFASSHPSSYYAEMYRRDSLTGGHVIMLGPGNEAAASQALAAYPGGLQIGGGITTENAASWLEKGASAVIVTSYVFKDGLIHEDRLTTLAQEIGKDNLVLDLSCRKKGDEYYIVTDRWQNFTEVVVNKESLDYFSAFCCEFLIHAVDVEGKCAGIEAELTEKLGVWTPLPTTYAGGVKNLFDMELILNLGQGKLDATVGSALDIFGGTTMTYAEAVAFHRQHNVS